MWLYADVSRDPEDPWSLQSTCRFCGTHLRELYIDEHLRAYFGVYACWMCGWWWARSDTFSGWHGSVTRTWKRASGALLELDLSDLRTPVQAVRDYLTFRYGKRIEVHPRVYEQVVGSVFSDHGYKVRVTEYRGDGGIDVLLERGAGGLVGVQVKRTVRSVRVEQLRALTGALVEHGLTRGMFVTTSRFQRGAAKFVHHLKTSGYQLELIDGARFFAELKLAQNRSERFDADFRTWALSKTRTVHEYHFDTDDLR